MPRVSIGVSIIRVDAEESFCLPERSVVRAGIQAHGVRFAKGVFVFESEGVAGLIEYAGDFHEFIV
jgi:hypothetical protein